MLWVGHPATLKQARNVVRTNRPELRDTTASLQTPRITSVPVASVFEHQNGRSYTNVCATPRAPSGDTTRREAPVAASSTVLPSAWVAAPLFSRSSSQRRLKKEGRGNDEGGGAKADDRVRPTAAIRPRCPRKHARERKRERGGNTSCCSPKGTATRKPLRRRRLRCRSRRPRSTEILLRRLRWPLRRPRRPERRACRGARGGAGATRIVRLVFVCSSTRAPLPCLECKTDQLGRTLSRSVCLRISSLPSSIFISWWHETAAGRSTHSPTYEMSSTITSQCSSLAKTPMSSAKFCWTRSPRQKWAAAWTSVEWTPDRDAKRLDCNSSSVVPDRNGAPAKVSCQRIFFLAP